MHPRDGAQGEAQRKTPANLAIGGGGCRSKDPRASVAALDRVDKTTVEDSVDLWLDHGQRSCESGGFLSLRPARFDDGVVAVSGDLLHAAGGPTGARRERHRIACGDVRRKARHQGGRASPGRNG